MPDALQVTIFETLMTLSLVSLGALIMYIIKRRDAKAIEQEAFQRDKDRELEREQREKDREQERYLKQLERNLHKDRMDVYLAILEPFIFLFSPKNTPPNSKEYRGKNNSEIALEILLGVEYKRTGFKLSIVGSDEVVLSFSAMMQYIYGMEARSREIALQTVNNRNDNTQLIEQMRDSNREDTYQMLSSISHFLLAIRKSVGNESTEIESLEMMRWLIKDIDDYTERMESMSLN